ncbi:NlpC/P60 family protein [Nonomuraea sp. NPDC046802]|uniref:NlpC/P60 family protein n=1 Tax=Nonomuraea sp. NPDC046802 TaxID=3154919 RepID=UPI0033C5D220
MNSHSTPQHWGRIARQPGRHTPPRRALGGGLLITLLALTQAAFTTPAQAAPKTQAISQRGFATRGLATRGIPTRGITNKGLTPGRLTPGRLIHEGFTTRETIKETRGTTKGTRGTTRGKIITKGQIAAAAALTQLGVSFSWGGGSVKGPSLGIGRGATTRGFDCSGLTLYAWSKAGVTLAHYTGTQFRQGRRIPLAARRTGDLLFFGGGAGDPTHVGLFLGGGVMIHAPKTGDIVRKTDFLRSPYFRSGFRGAVRPG